MFHAGTIAKDGKIVSSGGRVLVVSSFGRTVKEAVDGAYAVIPNVCFEGAVFRKDIAYR